MPDLDGFLAEDMGGPTVQGIMGQFLERVDGAEFVVAQAVE